MLQMTYVRPDRVMRTSVLEPTAEGYQPVQEAQAVADRFTRIYGPTVSEYNNLGGCCDGQGLGAVQEVTTTPQAVAAIAKAFAAGQQVRIRDSEGNVVDIRQPFWAKIIGKARAVVARAKGRGPQVEFRPPSPRPGAIPAQYGWAPKFNRASEAANRIIPAADRPPQSVYMPAPAGAQYTVPNAVTAAIIASGIPRGVPRMIGVRGQANAFDWFNRTGRYY